MLSILSSPRVRARVSSRAKLASRPLLVGFVVWKKRVSNEQREQYQMQDVSSLNFSLDSLNKGLAGKKGSRYQPLVSGYDDDGGGGGGGYEDEGNASLITHF